MNREIKFRAWDKETKEILSFEDIIDYSISDLADDETWSVMQYTGLKDKNGNEIYEGDILFYEAYGKQYRNEVKYINEEARYGVCHDPYYGWSIPKGTHGIEIIGNIYENPELLNNN